MSKPAKDDRRAVRLFVADLGRRIAEKVVSALTVRNPYMSDTTPTKDDLVRDLAADLATCEAASAGPWTMGPTPLYEVEDAEGLPVARRGFPRDMRMIAAARVGWPAAIRIASSWRARALAAESLLRRLVEADTDGRDGDAWDIVDEARAMLEGKP